MDLSNSQLRKVLSQQGFTGVHPSSSKKTLVDLVAALRLPQDCIDDVLSSSSQGGGGKAKAKKNGASGGSSWGLSKKDLHYVMRCVGVGIVKEYTAQDCELALKQAGMTHGDAKEVLRVMHPNRKFQGEHPGGGGGGGGRQKQQKGPRMKHGDYPQHFNRGGQSHQEPPLSAAEREFYGVAGGRGGGGNSGQSSRGRRQQSNQRKGSPRKKRGKRDKFDDWEDEEDEEFLRDFQRAVYGAGTSYATDDYYEYVLDEDPWDIDDDDEYEEMPDGWQRSHNSRGKAGYKHYARGPSYSASSAYGSSHDWSTESWQVPPSHGGPSGANGRRAEAQAAKPCANIGMQKALQLKWNCEHLTQTQACQLLGVSLRPSTEEVRAARKTLLHKWHPDRNPDDPNAGTALQLVVAAVRLLSK